MHFSLSFFSTQPMHCSFPPTPYSQYLPLPNQLPLSFPPLTITNVEVRYCISHKSLYPPSFQFPLFLLPVVMSIHAIAKEILTWLFPSFPQSLLSKTKVLVCSETKWYRMVFWEDQKCARQPKANCAWNCLCMEWFAHLHGNDIIL